VLIRVEFSVPSGIALSAQLAMTSGKIPSQP
jgi:hypothetical protein